MNCIDCASGKQAHGDGALVLCLPYESGMKGNPPRHKIESANVARGNRPDYGVFWPGERNCKLFKQRG